MVHGLLYTSVLPLKGCGVAAACSPQRQGMNTASNTILEHTLISIFHIVENAAEASLFPQHFASSAFSVSVRMLAFGLGVGKLKEDGCTQGEQLSLTTLAAVKEFVSPAHSADPALVTVKLLLPYLHGFRQETEQNHSSGKVQLSHVCLTSKARRNSEASAARLQS